MYRASEIPLTAPLPAAAESDPGRGISSFFGESGAFAELGRELRFPLLLRFPLIAESCAGREISSFFGESGGFRRVGNM